MILGLLASMPIFFAAASTPEPRSAPFPVQVIPVPYHGEWARESAQCGLSKGAAEKLIIGARHILFVPVVGLEQAGRPDRVKVWLGWQRRFERELTLALKGDVLTVIGQDGDQYEAVNCSRQQPDMVQAIGDGWLALAEDACRSEDTGAFLEALFSSDAVRQKYLAREVLVKRRGETGQRIERAYYRLPAVIFSANSPQLHQRLDDGRLIAADVRFADSMDAQGNWRVEWSASIDMSVVDARRSEESSQFYGSGGVLIFRRDECCWLLVEEQIGLPRQGSTQERDGVGMRMRNGD